MQPNDLRVHPKELEFLKQYWDIMLTSYEDGACFFITDLNTVTFKAKHKFDASVQQITAATNDVSGNQSHLHEEIQRAKEHLENINKVMGFIKEIADETKMLGLNAAIEAARVVEAGRGFGVVAEEIRKLSAESKKTVSQIRDLTGKIDKSVTETSSASESTLAVVEETSAAIQEVNATIEELTSIAGKLTQTAAKL